VGIVSARCVKGASRIPPGHTSRQSPTERPTPHDRMDRPIHPPGLRGLSPGSWPGRVAAASLATGQPRTIAVCDPRERLAPPRPTVRISSPEPLSYTIGSRQGLSYPFRTFSTVNLDSLDTIRQSPGCRQRPAASTKVQQGPRRDDKDQIAGDDSSAHAGPRRAWCVRCRAGVSRAMLSPV
jgi:hypothetical protein